MNYLRAIAGFLCLCTVAGCTSSVSQQETVKGVEGMSQSEAVVKTIMERRSIRKYKPQPVEREKMQTIVECGVNAPNAMNRQPWEIRVVDNPDFINGVTELYKKEQPKVAEDPNFKNMFRNAPTVVFIGRDVQSGSAEFDCGLLSENMMLAAQSMGIGSCCLGSPAAFMRSPAAAEYLKQLGFSEGYELLYCIAFGYPDEAPAAKPRDLTKIKFVE
ncbi:nitroreductase family protein [Phocaeicola barnesiae]|uniref:nitroreductase family protein n=1 Tax=Phocaeicola barnesiae TaxID=376804 RepID=UPI0025A3F9FA|nr:nitroreductase [Phocaeicola barnesiae]MDM8309171.1 nitroreductase [Phocaeicola barnesiae]